MKQNLGDINGKKAVEVLKETLTRVPFLSIQEIERNPVIPASKKYPGKVPDIDILAKVELSSSEEQLLIAKVSSNGQPRYVNLAISLFSRLNERFRDACFVFMAPYVSPYSAEICRQEGIGYIDFSGNYCLSFKNVFIEGKDYPSLFRDKRQLRSLFSPKATRVLRVLLDNPHRLWQVQELARYAKVSLGLVSGIKKRLLEYLFIEELAEGLRLKEPELLLNKWSENYSYEDNEISSYYSMKPIASLEAELSTLCRDEGINYALTGFSGAARLAPSVRYQQAMSFVDADNMERIVSRLNLKPADRGANVSLWKPYDEYVFYSGQEIDGVRVVSPEQLFLDLNRHPGRGREAAEAVLEEALKRKWQI